MDKLDVWSDVAAIQCELKKRLEMAKDKRKPFELTWQCCMKEAYMSESISDLPTVFQNTGLWPAASTDGQYLKETRNDGGQEYSKIYCNYVQKNLRYSLSQLSSNPPSVVPQASSSDPKDRRSAQAANQILKYGLRKYRLQEKKDLCALWMVTCGTGWLKINWNQQLGDPLEFNPETGEILTEGDIEVSIPRLWDVYPDPLAKTPDEIRFVFERFDFAKERALHFFGKFIEKHVRNSKEDTVEVYQYWEKGLPVNGFQGRFCWCLEDGTLLGDRIIANPHGPLKKLKNGKAFRMAKLPYHIFTEIDVPGTFWGVPAMLFTVAPQREVNMLDQLTFSCIRANGSSTLLVPEECEIGDDSVSNNPMDILTYSGGVPPTLHAPNPVAPIIPQIREMYAKEIPEIHGINESQFGKQSRETSGSAMQYATQNGAALSTRTFTKYVQLVEDVYMDYLEIVKERWTLPRKISVEGKEKSFHVIQFQASDIESGYEFQSKFGTDFSLDPNQRRQDILQLMPLFEKAGVDMRPLLSKLQLNDLETVFAELDLAADRQQDYFDKMLTSPTMEYFPPEDLEDHKNMIVHAKLYVMSAEFFHIDNAVVRENIKKHVRTRIEMAGKDIAVAAAPAPDGGGGQPMGAAEAAAAPEANLASLLGTPK